MEFKEAVMIALQSLWANKLRTMLTLLGVVIGVSSVIAVVTLVNGANTYVTTKFASYGADVFTVSKMPQIITCMLRRTASCVWGLGRSRRRWRRWCGERSR
jgi:putative ABC transport system permease protein